MGEGYAMRRCPSCSAYFEDGVRVCPADGAALDPPDPFVGTVVDGKYRIDALVGEGGMGVVYRATQLALRRNVAVKVIRLEASRRDSAAHRFEREALAVARLKHPHVVSVHDFGTTPDGVMYVVMEYLEGCTLRDELRRGGRLALGPALAWFAQAGAGVHAAHVAGVVHRDLKPDNVFLEDSADGRFAKVLDFGIARFRDAFSAEGPALTATGSIIGTAAYMSPEQAHGERVGPATDVYSLGCVLYEMLVGRPPFVGDSFAAILYQHISSAPAPPSWHVPDLPTHFDAIVLRALEKRPDDRFSSVAAFVRALASNEPTAETISLLPRERRDRSFDSSMDAEFAPTPVVPSHVTPHNLPNEVTRFVGREREIAEVVDRLAVERVLTLTGAGGIGKTRLAARVAGTVLDRFPDGVWLVELAALGDPAGVAKAVAAVLGAREEPGRSVLDTLRDHVGRRQLLVVLDNCEHVIAACADVAAALVRSAPNVHVLATSREPARLSRRSRVERRTALVAREQHGAAGRPPARMGSDRALRGPREAQQAGLHAHGRGRAARRATLPPARRHPARHRARRGAGERPLGPADPREAERRVPCAVGRRTLEPAAPSNAARDDRLELRLARGAGARALAPTGRVRRRMDTRGGGGICSGGVLDEAAVFDLLAHLVDKSLVIAEERDGGMRYAMPETIRQYSGAKLTEEDDAAHLHALHRAWFLAYAEEIFADFAGPDHERWHARMAIEQDNFLAGLEWGKRTGIEPAVNLRLCVALGAYWDMYGDWTRGRAWLEETLATGAEFPPALRARALFRAGVLANRQSDLRRAQALLEESLPLMRESGNQRAVAETLSQLGLISNSLSDSIRAAALLKEALEIHRASSQPIFVAGALHELGIVARTVGDDDGARRWLEESLAIFREIEFAQGIGYAQCELAQVARRQGDRTRSIAALEEAHRVAHDGWLSAARRARRLLQLGMVALDDGDVDDGARPFANPWRSRPSSARDSAVALALEGCARLWTVTGDARRAIVLAGAAAALRDEARDRLAPRDREELEQHLEPARRELGPDEEAAAFGYGMTLSRERAIAVALDRDVSDRAGTVAAAS
jgi:non-specific serine/threonine protein kinase